RPARRPVRTTLVKSPRRRNRCARLSISGSLAPRGGSSRQAGPSPGAAGADDGTTGPGTHPQPEAVGLLAAPVVRLEGALAHDRLSMIVVRCAAGAGRGGAGTPIAVPAGQLPRLSNRRICPAETRFQAATGVLGCQAATGASG